jgi:hypothetical protein
VTLAGEWTSYRRLRAPQDNGAHLVEPPLAAIETALASNHSALAADYDMQGRPLAALRSEARRDLFAAAQRYVRQYTDIDDQTIADDAPVILTGHQPQLFHPGVWFKNFLADHLAKRHGGVAIHVVIDADLSAAPSIRVPTGSIDSPTWKVIDYDAPSDRLPAEERTLIDAQRFATFGQRVHRAVTQLVKDPLIAALWPVVIERSKRTDNVGLCFAQARHLVERQWGSSTWEVPQSTVCGFEAFRWLTAHLLAHLPRFLSIHNAAVHEYRERHRIRTLAQPVPDLRVEAEWREAPFWIWSRDDPTRRPLWVRNLGAGLVISDRLNGEYQLPLAPDSDGMSAVEQIAALEARGVKIRPRALINTLYCRLLLSDLFIHGIGGAKYDQLTDQIIAGFFDLEPPVYTVATGTLRLPVERPAVDASDAIGLRQQLRQMIYHPENFLDHQDRRRPEVARWVDQKRHWIATEQTLTNARERYLAIREANASLQPALQDARSALLKRQTQVTAALRADAVLGSREWSFCLHPEKELRRFLAIDA